MLENKRKRDVENKKFEPIIHSKPRISLYPIEFPDIFKFYKNHESTFWTAGEIDYSEDTKHWDKLTNDEKYYIEMVLGFFAGSDFIVNEHIATNFVDKMKYLELNFYYDFQKMIENIHSNTYADLINTLVKNTKRKLELQEAVIKIPAVQKKAEWAKNYIYKNTGDEVETFVRRLIAFACVEGIFFSGSFCAIFWLKKRGLMPGLTFSNELISRDEGLHRDVACHIYKNHIIHKLEEKEVINIIRDAVKIEQEFVSDSLPVNLIGMNSELMCQYIEYVADHLLVNLIGYRSFNKENPFDWMALISLENKQNFFEGRVSNYSKGEIGEINFDESF
jgi:ribonucleoside-diphosphate reductase beta chain